jgi:hypothetical protein
MISNAKRSLGAGASARQHSNNRETPERRMSGIAKTLRVDHSKPGHWRVTLDNPPINLIDDSMYDAFYDLVGEIEADAALKVVTFESANPDFFIAHYGTSGPRSLFSSTLPLI